MAEKVVCTQCGMTEPPYWKDEPMNPELHAHVRAYISPVSQYHLTLSDAMAAWGITIEPEDLLL